MKNNSIFMAGFQFGMGAFVAVCMAISLGSLIADWVMPYGMRWPK